MRKYEHISVETPPYLQAKTRIIWNVNFKPPPYDRFSIEEIIDNDTLIITDPFIPSHWLLF